MATTTGEEGYFRLSLLMHKGGIWISKKILLRELAKTHKSPSLREFLKNHNKQLEKMRYGGYIYDEQFDLLFPRGWVDPNIDDWDLTLLIKIIRNLLSKDLKKEERSYLKDILRLRNENICHVTEKNLNLSEHAFNGLWERLTESLGSLASKFDEETVNTYSDMENKYKNWSNNLRLSIDELREICRNDDVMEKVLANLAHELNTKFDAINDKQDISLSILKEFYAKFNRLMEPNGVIDVDKPMEIPPIKLNLRIKGKDEAVVELSEVELLEVIQHCIKEHIHPNDAKGLIRAVIHVLDAIKKAGAVPVSVEKGSIILNIECPTLRSLENILNLLRMVHNRWRLHELEKALSEKFQAQMEVDLVLTENTIEMLSIWIDGCLNDTSNLLVGDMPCTRTLSMGIQCHSAEAVTKVVNYFHSEESTNRLNQLSEALSGVVQDEVMVDVQLDTKGFLEAFKTSNETEIMKQEHSRRNAEARTSDIECGPENVQNETEIMKQEQSGRDAEARTSDIECGPENVQNETEIMKQEQSSRDAEARTCDIECGPENVQTSMSDRFEDERYLNWLKLSFALKYTKEALESFTEREVLNFHNQLKALILGTLCLSSTAPPTCCSPTCTPTQLKKQWFQGTFKCPGNVCDTWINYILMHHIFRRRVVWENVNLSNLPLVPWECMKLFLPFGYQRQTTVQEFDLAALLCLYLDCRYFDKFFADPVIPCQDIRKQVKEVRNRVMHSGQMKVDTAQLLVDVATLKALLQDPQHLINDPDCQEGVRKIDKLMTGRLELSSNKELELRVLNSTMRELDDAIVQMQNKYEDISNELQTVSGDVEALNVDPAGNQALEADLQKLKNIADQFTSCMTTHIEQGVDTTRLQQCESTLQSHSQRVEQLLQEYQQHEQTIQQNVLQQLEQQEKTLHQHEQNIQQLDQRITELQKNITKRASTSDTKYSPEDVQKKQQYVEKLSLNVNRFVQNVLRERCGQSALKDEQQGQASMLSCKLIF